MARKKKGSALTTVLIVLVLAVISFVQPYLDKENEVPQKAQSEKISQTLEVHFIDVGQGDSIFIRLPGERTMLIDAGENDQGKIVCDYLAQHGVTKLNYVVATHPHSDHVGGLDTVIKAFDIGALYLPEKTHTSETFLEVIRAAQERKVETIGAKADVEVIQEKDLSVTFLSPVSEHYKELNNYSAMLSLRYLDTSFLFAGDAEYTVENEVRHSLSHHDVLKVGHHGSNSSSTANFLKAVSPDFAVISVGKNQYGHPHDQVLARLARFGSKIYRTDEKGSVVAFSDGKSITFQTER